MLPHIAIYSVLSYDTLGNITSLAAPSSTGTQYTYDNSGKLISETTTSGGTLSYTYNELNLKEELTNGRGSKRKYFYDALGRITGYICEEDSVSYTYDANGNVLTVTDKNGTVSREYDALNRVVKYTDTFGKVISYEYDSTGNITKITYPDNTAVNYTYDANNNLLTVTDWENRVTSYTYDVNNKVTAVTKPDGSIETFVYDDYQRVISTNTKKADNTLISGYEYTYGLIGRMTSETNLAENTKMCYTYDAMGRLTQNKKVNLSDNSETAENFDYDSAGNITLDSNLSAYLHSMNNCLTWYNGEDVFNDLDGNITSIPLSNVRKEFVYDSGNRLIKANSDEYTYNAENTRIRSIGENEDTVFTYDTNCRLSQLLMKTTNGFVTKYVYGLGLIYEECGEALKVYHFDYRGSTVAITDESGNVTDTFKYDSYGKLLNRTGTSNIIFGFNGKHGVITENNGLIYMRARYYIPEIRRFISADIIHGEIANSATLNRYAFAACNPISNIDPTGLSVERGGTQQNTVIIVLYDPEEFSRQAEDESKYLMSLYNSDKVLKIAIDNKQEFFDVWEQYSNNVKGMSLIFHGSPKHIWVGENLMVDDVDELEKAEMGFLRLLSCNGGHKDVENNMANAFKTNHNITNLYAMDGNLSFYPRNWYLIGHDYSSYGPRLSFWQSGFNKYASYERQFVGPNVGTGYINVKRQPTGFYLVQ